MNNRLGHNGAIDSAADVPLGSGYMATSTLLQSDGGFDFTTIGFSFTEEVLRVGAHVDSSIVCEFPHDHCFWQTDIPISLSAYDEFDALIEQAVIDNVPVSEWGNNFLGLESEVAIHRVEFHGVAMVLDGLTWEGAVMPEPSTALLLMTGLLGLASYRRGRVLRK